MSSLKLQSKMAGLRIQLRTIFPRGWIMKEMENGSSDEVVDYSYIMVYIKVLHFTYNYWYMKPLEVVDEVSDHTEVVDEVIEVVDKVLNITIRNWVGYGWLYRNDENPEPTELDFAADESWWDWWRTTSALCLSWRSTSRGSPRDSRITTSPSWCRLEEARQATSSSTTSSRRFSSWWCLAIWPGSGTWLPSRVLFRKVRILIIKWWKQFWIKYFFRLWLQLSLVGFA